MTTPGTEIGSMSPIATVRGWTTEGASADLMERVAIGKQPRELRSVTFLPEPEPQDRSLLLISVDDHVVEPPDLFEGRMPAKYLERTPRVIEKADGTQVWIMEGAEVPNVGVNAVVGRLRKNARPIPCASTRCAKDHGISTREFTTWTSTASTHQ